MKDTLEAMEAALEALELAFNIINRVPTRAHLLGDDQRELRELGKLVNAQGDGTHGYRVIADARDTLRAALAAAPAAQPVAPDGWKLLKDTTHDERSWNEDASHENGCYHNTCHYCGRMFTGHKRRVTCKACTAATPAPNAQAGWDSWKYEASEPATGKDHLPVEDATSVSAEPMRELVETMIASSTVLTQPDGTVVGYQIKTGALHRLIGMLRVSVPLGLPEIVQGQLPPLPQPEHMQEVEDGFHGTYKERTGAYTTEQMHAYADAALAASLPPVSGQLNAQLVEALKSLHAAAVRAAVIGGTPLGYEHFAMTAARAALSAAEAAQKGTT